MKASIIAVVGAITAFLSSGCGTVFNLASCENMENYGGVARDGAFFASLHLSPQGGARAGILLIFPAMLTEVSLSLLGDTLTLPITSFVQATRYEQEEKERWRDDGSIPARAGVNAVDSPTGLPPLPLEIACALPQTEETQDPQPKRQPKSRGSTGTFFVLPAGAADLSKSLRSDLESGFTSDQSDKDKDQDDE
jgi:hypothetical protein